jgi:hypothetical protein|tara:strand:+ start:53 stop:295 length:243 start_codon:yes stop_codon:yes gene_type:complete
MIDSADDKNFLTKTKFATMVEQTVVDKQMSYMDAVIHLCSENDIDPLDVRKFISVIIKDKIAGEAVTLNLLPGGNQLSFD